MKILFINLPYHGHVVPTIGLVQELIKQGCEVTYLMPFDWEEKVAESGAKFYGYKIRVISDTKNIFSSGEEITIIANTVFQEYFPVLSKGMKVVLPIGEIKGKYYFELCAYYVTEDEFVISAFIVALPSPRQIRSL